MEEGMKVSIRSEKIRDVEPPEPVYEEDPTLPYGTEKIVEQAQKGSVWKSYRVYTKDGTVVKEEPLHNSTYKAKPAQIKRNTTVMTEEPAGTGEAAGTGGMGEAAGTDTNTGTEGAAGSVGTDAGTAGSAGVAGDGTGTTDAGTSTPQGGGAAEDGQADTLPSQPAQGTENPIVPQNPEN